MIPAPRHGPDSRPLWERSELRQAAGDTLRPGGLTLTDRAAALANLAPGWPVLDVGAGLGATVAHLRRRHQARAVGVDPSAIQLARRPEPETPLLRARAEALPFADGAFRMVLCECVLSLVPRADKALAEYARVLVPGGWLGLSDMYLKDEILGAKHTSDRRDSCANQAMPIRSFLETMHRAGFEISLFEDHTRLLKELAARLIFTGAMPCRTHRPGVGYFLLMARKPEADHA